MISFVIRPALSSYDSMWIEWYARRDLNPRPSVPKTDALSPELRAHEGCIASAAIVARFPCQRQRL